VQALCNANYLDAVGKSPGVVVSNLSAVMIWFAN
jgi:hypothetical protein